MQKSYHLVLYFKYWAKKTKLKFLDLKLNYKLMCTFLWKQFHYQLKISVLRLWILSTYYHLCWNTFIEKKKVSGKWKNIHQDVPGNLSSYVEPIVLRTWC